jgi:uncharacterized metal-binding protein
MHGDFPPFEELYYSTELRDNAHHAALVEAEGYCEWTRIREIAEYAKKLGVERIGIAHCADMAREARLAAEYLGGRQLEPLLPSSSSGCDPVAQIEFFASRGTELNVIAGMCVAHEALFISESEQPVISLVARDMRLRHNPVAALYTSGSYSRSRLFDDRDSADWAPYEGNDLAALKRVAQALEHEDQSDLNRVQEVMAFARHLGIRDIGFSFCTGFRQEARLLAGVLKGNGFNVASVCCKTGAVPKEKIGITDSEQVRPGQPEMICNPLAQAELLNRDKVQLVLSLGQCVGHEAATLGSLKAPAVCIVAKDRVLGHNTVAALYELEGSNAVHHSG